MKDVPELLNGMRATAEPTRLRLLALCAHADLRVNELAQILGQSQPRISHNLKILYEAGVLDRSREGVWAFYRLAAEAAAERSEKWLSGWWIRFLTTIPRSCAT